MAARAAAASINDGEGSTSTPWLAPCTFTFSPPNVAPVSLIVPHRTIVVTVDDSHSTMGHGEWDQRVGMWCTRARRRRRPRWVLGHAVRGVIVDLDDRDHHVSMIWMTPTPTRSVDGRWPTRTQKLWCGAARTSIVANVTSVAR